MWHVENFKKNKKTDGLCLRCEVREKSFWTNGCSLNNDSKLLCGDTPSLVTNAIFRRFRTDTQVCLWESFARAVHMMQQAELPLPSTHGNAWLKVRFLNSQIERSDKSYRKFRICQQFKDCENDVIGIAKSWSQIALGMMTTTTPINSNLEQRTQKMLSLKSNPSRINRINRKSSNKITQHRSAAVFNAAFRF